jgi:hypothetical protein
MKLTRTAIEELPSPPEGKREYVKWDDTLPGFGVRVRTTSKVWRIQYRVGRQQRSDKARDLARWIKSRRPGMKLSPSLDPLIHPPVELILGSLTAAEIRAAIESYLYEGTVVRWRDRTIPVPAAAATSPAPAVVQEKLKVWLPREVTQRREQNCLPEGITKASLQLHSAALDAVRDGRLRSAPVPRRIEAVLRELKLFQKRKRK